MNILFIGDIVGKSGRDVVSSSLDSLKKEFQIDLTIANGENSAHGKGITYNIYKELVSNGIDYITLGNHSFSKSEILNYIDLTNKMIFPYNHIKRNNERYYLVVNVKGLNICICNILGMALMGEVKFSPFEAMDRILEETKNRNVDCYFVDLHGEATAEKLLFANYYKDKVAAVVGTHTHIQTADERMFNNLAYISDVGMCGVYDSIIGRDIEECIKSSILKEETHYTIADGPSIFCGVVIEIDDNSKKATSIKRIQIRP